MLELDENDHIVCAYAEYASGPGWANRPIWVIVQDGDKNLRRECIQPDDQSLAMTTLYRVSNEAHRSMTIAVRSELEK